jgi:hypothetical protein
MAEQVVRYKSPGATNACTMFSYALFVAMRFHQDSDIWNHDVVCTTQDVRLMHALGIPERSFCIARSGQ